MGLKRQTLEIISTLPWLNAATMQEPNRDLNCCKVMGRKTTPLEVEAYKKMLNDDKR